MPQQSLVPIKDALLLSRQKKPPITPLKDALGLGRARAAAKSREFNPKNLELVWYLFWNRCAMYLASRIDVERCTIGPQYPLWRLHGKGGSIGHITVIPDDWMDEDDEDEGEGEGEDEDEDEGMLGAEDEQEIDDIEEGDTSLSTIAETINEKTRSRITDFAILLWNEDNTINTFGDDEADEVFHIETEFIPLLIEVKRSPSRKLEGEKLARATEKLMVRAQEDVFRQALYLFANHRRKSQKSVLVIAAVGDMWTWTTVRRSEPDDASDNDDHEEDPGWEPSIDGRYEAADWSEMAVWGRPKDGFQVDIVARWTHEHFFEEHGISDTTTVVDRITTSVNASLV